MPGSTGRARSSCSDGARSLGDLGAHFGGTLYEREVTYLSVAEWARTAEDILDRRTKHGLHVRPEARAALADLLMAEVPA